MQCRGIEGRVNILEVTENKYDSMRGRMGDAMIEGDAVKSDASR